MYNNGRFWLFWGAVLHSCEPKTVEQAKKRGGCTCEVTDLPEYRLAGKSVSGRFYAWYSRLLCDVAVSTCANMSTVYSFSGNFTYLRTTMDASGFLDSWTSENLSLAHFRGL